MRQSSFHHFLHFSYDLSRVATYGLCMCLLHFQNFCIMHHQISCWQIYCFKTTPRSNKRMDKRFEAFQLKSLLILHFFISVKSSCHVSFQCDFFGIINQGLVTNVITLKMLHMAINTSIKSIWQHSINIIDFLLHFFSI